MALQIPISSEDNPRYRTWKKILDGSHARLDRTLVSGSRVVSELAAKHPDRCLNWIVPEDFAGDLPATDRTPVCLLKQSLFRRVDPFGTGFALLEVDTSGLISELVSFEPGLHVAVPFQDPANAGAVIRSAVGLGATSVVLLPGACSPFHPRAIRASSGTCFSITILKIETGPVGTSCGLPLVFLDAGGMDIRNFRFPTSFLLVAGVEGPGLAAVMEGFGVGQGGPRRISLPSTGPVEDRNSGLDHGEGALAPTEAYVVSLPMETIECYNAAVAASLAMYEWRRGREIDCQGEPRFHDG